MAFSKSLPKGQIPVGCQLCEGGNKIEWKCTDCNLLMCDRCKTKVHVKIAKDHRIVNIREIGEVEDSWDSFSFSDLKCQDHSSQPCSLYCGTCSKVICLKCIVKVHNGHTFVDEEEFDGIKEEMREGQKKLQRNITKLGSEKENLIQETENAKLILKRNILDQKTKIHKSVDQFADNLVQDVDRLFRTSKQDETQFSQLIQNMHAKNENLESIITSRDFMKFFRDFDKLKDSFKEDISQETMKISSSTVFVPGEFTVLNFGTLEDKGLIEHDSKFDLKVTNKWTTDLKNIHFMVRCPDGTLWIADNLNTKLQHIELQQDKVKVLSSFTIDIYGLAEITSSNILLSAGETRLKIIKGRTKQITESVFNIAPFISRDIHVTKDERVIIAARSTGNAFAVEGKRFVIVMDREGNRLTEYYNDNNKKPYFILPLMVASTNYGNICVGDCLDDGCRGRVVVIDQDGNTKGIYTGHHDVNTKDKPFTPSGILQTPADNIVVTDRDNHFVHILDSEGIFILYRNVQDIGICYPSALALSTSGHFYIGGSNLLFDVKFEGI